LTTNLAAATSSHSDATQAAKNGQGRRFVAGAGLSGREAGNRARLVKDDGGGKDGEIAMEAGLIWIANHQRPNGGWLFDHRNGACQGRCRNPGTVASTTASTGLAIMAFLGAGYTHREGPFQREMDKGLYYLTGRMLATPHGGDLQEGTMYAQGIATLALCEAYAMTGDASLRPFAQKAVDFVVYAQNPKTGGWRYFPGQPGDTTVLGWQLMALRSARMAELDVPEEVIYKATKFLDSVQAGDGNYLGAFYGYQSPDRTNFTTNSVGLLCRMYTGWQRSNMALIHGVDAISKQGPSQTDMYYNYQATQVMHHWGGKQWRQWNEALRDYLIRSQAREGHEFGSWYFDDKHSAQGGRLYNTAMAAMMLQVYYRYLPLYTDKATTSGQAAVSTRPPHDIEK
ncbi:MAG: prenyltransferase/squalene oxidase repeat-containing protein, partial [Pirellulales bacterium]